MEDIVVKFKRDVIERQIAEPTIPIRDSLVALYEKAQKSAVSAVDLTTQARQLRQSVIESEPYRIGNTEGAKDGQKKAYPLLKELESYLDSTLQQAQ
jgi:hypothetical protein